MSPRRKYIGADMSGVEVLTRIREELAEKTKKRVAEREAARPKLSHWQRWAQWLKEKKKQRELDKREAERREEAEREARRYVDWFIQRIDQKMKVEPLNFSWWLFFCIS